VVFIAIFTVLYKYADPTLKIHDALYLSVSFQTFTGAYVEDNKNLKIVSTVQMFISYILVSIVLYKLLEKLHT
jgi:hypothetical protein